MITGYKNQIAYIGHMDLLTEMIRYTEHKTTTVLRAQNVIHAAGLSDVDTATLVHVLPLLCVSDTPQLQFVDSAVALPVLSVSPPPLVLCLSSRRWLTTIDLPPHSHYCEEPATLYPCYSGLGWGQSAREVMD